MESFSFFELNLKKKKAKDKSFNKKILNCHQKKTPKPFDPLDQNSPSHKYKKKKKKLSRRYKSKQNPNGKINNK